MTTYGEHLYDYLYGLDYEGLHFEEAEAREWVSEVEALLRVARVVKAWINLYNDGPLPNFASWREAEKEIEAALKEVEHLLG